MDQERDRVQADLRGVLEGDVHCDDIFVQMYASDASIYEIQAPWVSCVRGALKTWSPVSSTRRNIRFRSILAVPARGWPASRSVPV